MVILDRNETINLERQFFSPGENSIAVSWSCFQEAYLLSIRLAHQQYKPGNPLRLEGKYSLEKEVKIMSITDPDTRISGSKREGKNTQVEQVLFSIQSSVSGKNTS